MVFPTLAFRNLRAKKIRSVLTVFGIALGVSLIFSVGITQESTVNSYVNLVSDLSGQADLQITDTSQAGFPLSTLDKVRETKGVDEALPSVSKISFLVHQGQKEELQILGVDPKNDQKLRRYRFREGSFLSSKDSFSIILVKEWAEDKGIGLNQSIEISTFGEPYRFKVKGLITKVGPGAAQDGAVGIVSLKAAQDIFGLSSKITQIDVKVQEDSDIDQVKKELEQRLEDFLVVERPESKGASVENATRAIVQTLDSFAILTLLIGVFIVFNTMLKNVSERRREIGMLRAVGMSRGQVLRLILLEGGLLGAGGVLIGLLLGWQLAKILTQTTASIYHLSFPRLTIPLQSVFRALLAGIGGSLMAALHPAWQATHVTPLTALRPQAAPGKKWLERRGWILGGAFILLSLFLVVFPSEPEIKIRFINAAYVFLLLGVAFFTVILITPLANFFGPLFQLIFKTNGRMARDNLSRSRSRSALGIVTLLTSLVLVIAAGELRLSTETLLNRWINSALSFDLSVRNPIPFSLLTTNKYPSLKPELASQIKKVEGVKKVSPVKFYGVKGLGRDIFALFVEPKTWKSAYSVQLEEGDIDQALKKLEKGGAVIISSTISKKNRLHLGDTLKLQTPRGKKSFKVSGVVLEVGNDGYTVYLSRYDQRRYFGTETADTFAISLAPGASPKKVKKELKERFEKPYHTLVLSNSEIKEAILGSLNQFLSMLDSLSLIAIFVAGLGILNTLTMNVADRVREMGILRAIGSTRSQIEQLILAEAGLMGLIGALLGILTGVVNSRLLIVIANIISGWPIKYVFPYGPILIALAISLGVSVLAAIYPARKAAKVNIVKAVQYE